MEDTLINFETAKLAKEKGFTDDISGYYDEKGILQKHFGLIRAFCKAPTQSLLQKWLREVHKINVSSDLWDYLGEKQLCTYQYNILKIDPNSDYIKSHKPKPGTSYEEALETGLQKALKLIKNNKK